jgi:hypothetical protein
MSRIKCNPVTGYAFSRVQRKRRNRLYRHTAARFGVEYKSLSRRREWAKANDAVDT